MFFIKKVLCFFVGFFCFVVVAFFSPFLMENM